MTCVVEQEFGGWPFLDTGFNASRLLTAVACARWNREHTSSEPPRKSDLISRLQPAEAKRIRGLDLTLDLPHGLLTTDQQDEVAQARHHINDLITQWNVLLTVPLEFLLLQHSQAISSSNFAWPQHIFLAPTAFAAATSLCEQVLHETSHQWLYFIEEIWPLQRDDATRRFTLPSGTAGRSASELLGATHVVVNLNRLWTVMPADEIMRRRRLDHLRIYGAGCQRLLGEASDVLTAEGQALAVRLSKELHAL